MEEIRRIYNHAILNTVATFDLQEKGYGEMGEWFREHGQDHPIYVLSVDGFVRGWAALSPLYKKAAYRRSAELSIYLDPGHQGRGYGTLLLETLIDASRERHFHTLVSRIAGDNEASIRLHRRYGFHHQGTLKETGFKFNRFIDVEIFQLMLEEIIHD